MNLILGWLWSAIRREVVVSVPGRSSVSVSSCGASVSVRSATASVSVQVFGASAEVQ